MGDIKAHYTMHGGPQSGPPPVYKKKESKETPMKTKPVGEQFHAVANAAISMMVRIQESPRAGRVTPLLARLDKVANKAADAVAARMMGEENPGYEFPELFKELKEIHAKLKASIGEGWHMFPALGLGNDFSMESPGGAWEPAEDKGTGTGLPSLPDVAAAFSNTSGTDLGKAESTSAVDKYVDSLLNESSSDSGDPKCSKSHSKDNPDKGGGGKVDGKWVCNAHYPKKK